MKAYKCYYSVIKYLPDVIKNEPRNIGIVILSEKTKETKMKFVKILINKLGVSANNFDIEIIQKYIMDFETRILNAEFLEKHSSDLRGKIQFSEPRMIYSQNIENQEIKLQNKG